VNLTTRDYTQTLRLKKTEYSNML